MNYTINHRKNLIKYWRQYYPKWNIPKGYHVHHIKPKCTFEDKNDPAIHHPKNLIALHPDDHATIHKLRGDKAVALGFLSVRGYKHSAETKQKIRFSNLGKKITPAQKIKMSMSKIGVKNAFYGKKHTRETKLKLSVSQKGRNFGIRMSIETKHKISQSKTGIKRKPFTEEHKEKLSIALKGIKRKPFTEEHKEKLKQAKLDYYARNKLN